MFPSAAGSKMRFQYTPSAWSIVLSCPYPVVHLHLNLGTWYVVLCSCFERTYYIFKIRKTKKHNALCHLPAQTLLISRWLCYFPFDHMPAVMLYIIKPHSSRKILCLWIESSKNQAAKTRRPSRISGLCNLQLKLFRLYGSVRVAYWATFPE